MLVISSAATQSVHPIEVHNRKVMGVHLDGYCTATKSVLSCQAGKVLGILLAVMMNQKVKARSGTPLESKFSEEHIKPSSPTPQNLRYFKLSMFDQIQISIYYPFTFFYPNNKNNNNKNVEEIITERSNHLKQSLSETLTQFYPFAGKVASELHIDCNDEGVYFIETRVDDRLENVLKKPDNKFLQRLIPVVNSVPNQQLLGSYVSMVQVNFFSCGGVAITVQHNHKLVDGASYMIFLKAWAAIARRDSNLVNPSFVSSSMFPQNPQLPYAPYVPIWCLTISPAYLKHGQCATKRFVFDALALRELKAKASKHQPVSRVVAVLAFALEMHHH
ncbi:unnamed protein product [Lactuca virosa]|uniref:Transferase, Chloramphenicol acetyltransferase-like domain protein n=1 Tax=Lactuca virosa TaxID=75947 RepID=A0AAU9NRC6_9ASTR|nr:unnamed protein product [Lactuca virosa]